MTVLREHSGTVVGALPGLVGAGGAIVAVPALVSGLGLPARVTLHAALQTATRTGGGS